MRRGLSFAFCLVCINVFGQSKSGNQDWITLQEKEYSVKYPQEWEMVQNGQGGSSFIIFSKQSSTQDQFRENVNLLIQNLAGSKIDLDKFVEISESQIKTLITNGHIVASERINGNGSSFHKEVYTGDQGIFKLKFEQYYWVKNEKAYILTFTAEANQFDIYKETGEDILKSFSFN